MSKAMITELPIGHQAIELISEMADECPNCGSVDIANDQASDMVVCHECGKPFELDACTEQKTVVRALQKSGFSHEAERIKQMSKNEYAEFLENYIF